MAIPIYRFPSDITLINLGDIHLGHKHCDHTFFERIIEWIRLQPDNVRWISTGDMCESAIRQSIGDPHHSMAPDEEINMLADYLAPIAKQCLGFVSSNHSRRIQKEGMSWDDTFNDKLQLRGKVDHRLYLGDLAVIKIVANSLSYFVLLHHGMGGGRLRGSKIINLERLSLLYPALDCYLSGHTHSYATFRNSFFFVDRKRNITCNCDSTYCCTGHFLEYAHDLSYIAQKAIAPMPIGAAKLVFKSHPAGRNEFKDIAVSLMTKTDV